jgi:hypothetical protein
MDSGIPGHVDESTSADASDAVTIALDAVVTMRSNTNDDVRSIRKVLISIQYFVASNENAGNGYQRDSKATHE